MTRLIRSEILKLRTTRLTVLLLAATALLTVLMSVLVAWRAGGGGMMSPASLGTTEGQRQALTMTRFGLVFAMILGAVIANGEFRTTATATYLATPRRGRVLVAKLIAALIAGAGFGLIAAAAATATGLTAVAIRGYEVTLPAGTIAGYAGGAVLAAALLAAIGVGIGSLVRSSVGAVVGILVEALLVEHLGEALFSSVVPYLPFTAANSLAGLPFSGDVTALPRGAVVVVLAAVAAGLAIIASRTVVRRDIA